MPSKRYLKKRSELGRKMAKARWDADRARREAERPAREAEMAVRDAIAEHARLPGDYMGTLEWRDRSGQVRRWVVRRAQRIDQIRVDGVAGARSWTWLLDRLRRRLCGG